jgi:2-polyprenyl-6-hydroxyphenyl methylase/3-demethylubiquinone-9 3-methyltransferase
MIYRFYWLLGCLHRRQNPIHEARQYRRSRGMALWTDQVDWLGGYPYEFATAQDIITLCEGSLGLVCKKLVPSDGTGNNQFVFLRPGG